MKTNPNPETVRDVDDPRLVYSIERRNVACAWCSQAGPFHVLEPKTATHRVRSVEHSLAWGACGDHALELEKDEDFTVEAVPALETCLLCRRHGWVCPIGHSPRFTYSEAESILREYQRARNARRKAEREQLEKGGRS